MKSILSIRNEIENKTSKKHALASKSSYLHGNAKKVVLNRLSSLDNEIEQLSTEYENLTDNLINQFWDVQIK